MLGWDFEFGLSHCVGEDSCCLMVWLYKACIEVEGSTGVPFLSRCEFRAWGSYLPTFACQLSAFPAYLCMQPLNP